VVTDSERSLYAIAALVCFAAVAYGVQTYLAHPNAELLDVLPMLLMVVPGSVSTARALGSVSNG